MRQIEHLSITAQLHYGDLVLGAVELASPRDLITPAQLQITFDDTQYHVHIIWSQAILSDEQWQAAVRLAVVRVRAWAKQGRNNSPS